MLLGLALAVFGGLLVRAWTSREPEFHGRSVSSWFRQYSRSIHDENAKEESQLALRALGTNAVSFLLRECFSTHQDSAASTNFQTFLAHLPWPFRFAPFVSANEIRETAAEMVQAIKPPAAFILPYVTNAFKGTNQGQHRMAIYLLADIGEGAERAVPWLRLGLRSSDAWLITLAMRSAERLGRAAREVVPDLMAGLTNVPIQRRFLWGGSKALASIGHEAAPAIPLLKERFLGETDIAVRLVIAGAVCRIDPQESALLDDVIGEMTKLEDKARLQQLLNLLGEIGPSAKAAIPFLQGLLTDKDPRVWWSGCVCPSCNWRRQESDPATSPGQGAGK